jgi:hypothetical protein
LTDVHKPCAAILVNTAIFFAKTGVHYITGSR